MKFVKTIHLRNYIIVLRLNVDCIFSKTLIRSRVSNYHLHSND